MDKMNEEKSYPKRDRSKQKYDANEWESNTNTRKNNVNKIVNKTQIKKYSKPASGNDCIDNDDTNRFVEETQTNKRTAARNKPTCDKCSAVFKNKGLLTKHQQNPCVTTEVSIPEQHMSS